MRRENRCVRPDVRDSPAHCPGSAQQPRHFSSSPSSSVLSSSYGNPPVSDSPPLSLLHVKYAVTFGCSRVRRGAGPRIVPRLARDLDADGPKNPVKRRLAGKKSRRGCARASSPESGGRESGGEKSGAINLRHRVTDVDVIRSVCTHRPSFYSAIKKASAQ